MILVKGPADAPWQGPVPPHGPCGRGAAAAVDRTNGAFYAGMQSALFEEIQLVH